MTLGYLQNQLNKKDRREVIRHMKQYKNIDAIIKSRKLDLLPSHTVTYEEKPSQRTNSFYSEAEEYTFEVLKIEEYSLVKKKLDYAYGSVKPIQKLIWDEHFIDGRNDPDIYNEQKNKTTRKAYYREKSELIQVVAECLSINTK